MREVDVLLNYMMSRTNGCKIIYREAKERTCVIMYKFNGVDLRGVNVLIRYDLMNKDGSEREGKGRIVGYMFKFEGWG